MFFIIIENQCKSWWQIPKASFL